MEITVAIAALVLTAGSLLGLASAALRVWERLDRPTAWDHLRHCLLLYPVVLLGGFFLLNMPPGLEHGIVHGVVGVTWIVTLSGVLSNAAVLGGYHIRRLWERD
jgi:ABC-type uncharacterized transport system permease subunit